MAFRSDIIDGELVLKALQSLHRDAEKIEINSFKSQNATAKGENFLGDLASLEVFAKIEKASTGSTTQVQYKTFLWMVKMLKPDAGGGFNLGRILGTFEFEALMYKVRISISKFL